MIAVFAVTPKNNFTFNINFKNTDKINTFFKTGIVIADKKVTLMGPFLPIQ